MNILNKIQVYFEINYKVNITSYLNYSKFLKKTHMCNNFTTNFTDMLIKMIE